MSTKTKPASFEQKLEELEALVEKLEQGGLPLDEVMKLYQQGNKLAKDLEQELEAAQESLQKLRTGVLTPMDDEHAI
ncbi:MAG: exodeoxyribonuclease VII small subunit [Clostridiales bacterium]|jgi:exodeoxyribonuclease VII small subunit|nr:exodeoxyribonuclease VII small subunit [Clostridiales bacterium]